MAKARGYTVLSFLGTQLDARGDADRWHRWRPNVSLCQHEEHVVSRLVLVSDRRHLKLFNQVRDDLAAVSPETKVEHREAAMKDPWDFESVFDGLYALADELAFDPARDDLLVHMTTGTHVQQICLFLLAESRHLPARLLQTGPPRSRAAADQGGPGTWQIIDLDLSRFDRIAQRFAERRRAGESLLKSGIATRSDRFNELIAQIERVAPVSAAPILLMGPTGAGKSQLARRIHELKRQRHQVTGAFVEVNCATIRGDAAQSALFGHKKGAFTGALHDRQGLLRSADKGLLFLDEIGELGRDEQAMLLRALEEKRFLPLGSDRDVHSDFQLIAGTNRDLNRLVARGEFRDDLLARINLWTFRLPGLRERIDDLEPNVDYELERFSATVGRRVHFNAEARRRYLDFATAAESHWRGNFRDLNASITRLCTLADGGRITETDVAAEIARLQADWSREPGLASEGERSAPDDAAADDALLAELIPTDRLPTIDRFDRVQLAAVVRACRRHRSLSAAGRELFAASRQQRSAPNDADRLRKYLLRFGLDFATATARA